MSVCASVPAAICMVGALYFWYRLQCSSKGVVLLGGKGVHGVVVLGIKEGGVGTKQWGDGIRQ